MVSPQCNGLLLAAVIRDSKELPGPGALKEFERLSPALRYRRRTSSPKSNGGEGIKSNVYFPLAPMGRGAKGEGVPDPFNS